MMSGMGPGHLLDLFLVNTLQLDQISAEPVGLLSLSCDLYKQGCVPSK